MKSKLFYKAIFFAIFLVIELNASSKSINLNDSLSIYGIDSTFEGIYSLFNLPNLPQNEKGLENPLINAGKLNTASWPNISSWGNKKRKHGRYRENEMNETGPYFLFDRYTNGQLDEYEKLNKKLEDVRDIIKMNQKFDDIYDQILIQANLDLEICGDEKDGFCVGASRAKAAAFVYLIGLKANDTTFTIGERNEYRDKVLNYFKYVRAKGLDNFWDNLTWIPIAGNVASFLGALGNWEKLVYRSKELINIVQAMDLIRWGYKLDNDLAYSSEIEDKLEEYSLRIIDKFVVPIHTRAANGVYLFAQNNYSLIISSSMICSAIEFNDFGVRWFNVESRPNRWAESGYSYIHKTLWKGNKKQTSEGNLYGYAEGPGYFQYGFNAILPMTLARYNFSKKDETNGYSAHAIAFSRNYVRNYWYDKDYHNLYTWYNNLIQPDGWMPTLDDTKHENMFNPNFAILRKSAGTQLNFIDFLDVDMESPNFSLREDYICALQPPDLTHEYKLSVNMASGDAVFRSRKGIDIGNHYMAISNENDISDNGGYHEQEEDQGSFIIVADKDLLCFDPPYYDDGNFWDLMRNNDNFRDQIKKREHHNALDVGGNYSWKDLSQNTEELRFYDNGDYGVYGFKKELECLSDCSDDSKKNYWTRTYLTYRNDGSDIGYYYVIMDKVELNNHSILTDKPKFTFSVHGNGDNNSYNWNNGGFIEWTYPCMMNPNPNDLQNHYGLRAIVSSSVPSTTSFSII